MKYSTIQPPASLAKYVRFFWVLEGRATAETPYIHRAMPDSCPKLVFHYRTAFDELITENASEKTPLSACDGQSQAFKRFYADRDFGMFGAYLYPFAISQLFSIPTIDLSDQILDLKTLLGKHENGLEEMIMLAPDTPARVKILTRFLENRLPCVKSPPPGVFETINYIIETNGVILVQELAERNFLSVRQFERNFKQFSGFSPKLYSRIVRFQNALRQYGKQNRSLTQIAMDCGYSDQSHFIREFKDFAGYTPKEFFNQKAEGTEWRKV